MIRDLERERPATRPPADVCVVGAGAAGITLAVELLAQGKRVTLLEAGGSKVEAKSQELHRSELAGLPHRGIHTGRTRVLGGSTTHWSGEVLEFDARDFEPRQSVPGSGWPFSKSTLTPSYAIALELEGLARVIRKDSAVWESIDLAPPIFEGLNLQLARFCPQPNLAEVHRRILEKDPDLELWLHANVVELILEGETATKVRARTLGGVEAHFSAALFVFCLGAIESSRFFLQPRPGGLRWNRSGLLGRHVQDHFVAPAATVRPTDPVRFHAAFDNIVGGGFEYQPTLRLPPAAQDQHRSLNCAAVMHFHVGPEGEPEAETVHAKEPTDAVLNLPQLFRRVVRTRLSHRAYNPANALIDLKIRCEQQPDSPSSITLAGNPQDRDALGLHRARLDWQITPHELATVRAFALQIQQALAPIASVVLDPDLLANDRAFRLKCVDSNHTAGGMRMTSSPENGVVDLNLRLHGTANCYLCSAAVLPTSSFADPTHTVLALAVRLAEYLRNPGTM